MKNCPAEQVTPNSETTPSPDAVAAATATPTPARHIAPEGTYFLLELVSINTAAGVIGDRPGTKVAVVKRETSKLQVSDAEHHIFSVKPSQLTNDIDVAAEVAKRDADRQ
ncbi:MAG TPA: hypothetical protein VJT08_11510, partial [Terriglobales bacterium]|nr:hypothetical protein [Terriglobales bacterium]